MICNNFVIIKRNIYDIKQQLAEVIEKHITEYGVTTFTIGHYGSFDRLAQEVLLEVKKVQPHIKLYLLLPYHPSHQSAEVPRGFDGTVYPEGMETVPKRFAIIHANNYMIKNSDYLISYCKHIGNTRNLVEYAQRLEKKGGIKVTLL